MRTIIRLQRRCDIEGEPLLWELDKCLHEQKLILLEYRTCILSALAQRGKWLYYLIEQKILIGDTDAAATIQHMKAEEEQSNMHQCITSVVGKQKAGGVCRTIVPVTANEGSLDYTKQDNAEHKTLTYLSTLFHSADDTVLKQPPLVDLLGCLGGTISGDDITEETFYIPHESDEYTALFLEK